MKRIFTIFTMLVCCLIRTYSVCGQVVQTPWETVQKKLKASRISVRGNLKFRPNYGFPVRVAENGTVYNPYCNDEFSEKIHLSGTNWLSENPENGIVNWISSNDSLATILVQAVKPVISQWYKEKPGGEFQVVCGPMKDSYWIALCKKTGKEPGWKSIAFEIPSDGIVPSADSTGPTDIFKYSESVNILEYKCGYDLFCNLLRSVQEAVEGITACELFCPFVEAEANHFLEESFEVESPDAPEPLELDFDGF